MTRPVLLHPGAGWRTPKGALGLAVIEAAARAMGDAYRAAAGSPDAVLVAGESKDFRRIDDGRVPVARADGYAVAAVPLGLLLRTFADDPAFCDRVREAHEGRGEGRAVVVVTDRCMGVTRVVIAEADVDALSGPVAEAGEA